MLPSAERTILDRVARSRLIRYLKRKLGGEALENWHRVIDKNRALLLRLARGQS